MTRSLLACLLACTSATAMSAAVARDIPHLSPADAGGDCAAEVAAAKAEAGEPQADDVAAVTAKPQTAPIRRQPSVRGGDSARPGTKLQAPRWHSFLPGMFR